MLLAPTFQSAWLVGAQRCWSVEIDHRRDIGAHDTLGDWCDAFADIPDVDLATRAYSPYSGLPRQRRRESGTRNTAAEDAVPPRGIGPATGACQELPLPAAGWSCFHVSGLSRPRSSVG